MLHAFKSYKLTVSELIVSEYKKTRGVDDDGLVSTRAYIFIRVVA